MQTRSRIIAAVGATVLAGGLAIVAPAAHAERVAFNVTVGGPGYALSFGDGYRHYAPYGYGYRAYAPAPVYVAPPVTYYEPAYAPAYRAYPVPVYRPYVVAAPRYYGRAHYANRHRW